MIRAMIIALGSAMTIMLSMQPTGAFARATAPATAAPAQAAPEPLTEDELEVLVARVARYPDELVALISAASLYPLQLVEGRAVSRRPREEPRAEAEGELGWQCRLALELS